MFSEVQQILAVRGDAGSRRRAANTDYDLTGLITCADCGLKYIGTSAQGRSRTYRYYTCFSRVRYGRHGCTGPRLPADDAVLTALIDLYANTDLLDKAIAAERHLRIHRHQATTDALASFAKETKMTEESLDRYLTAFEHGRLGTDECAGRVRALKMRLDQLTWRKNDLVHELTTEPAGPSQAAIKQLRTQLADVFRHGTPGQRKKIIETHLAEITLDSGEIIPVFRVPAEANEPVESSTGSPNTVRAMQTMAPRSSPCANRFADRRLWS